MARPQRPFAVLIVEDEALLCMDIEAMVTDEGHDVVGEAMSLNDVMEIDLSSSPDLAFVDMQLSQGSSGLDVCAYIQAHWPETTVIFVTANPKLLPRDFAGAYGVIPKPFTRIGLQTAMRYIEQGISNPPPSLGLPKSFVPGPRVEKDWHLAH